ncbi:MAG: TonB C-terminal domain-containing protein, partial [Lentisphaeria bacterium]|nr:TonB C-terminal domain-containing protein [Lentisphaeria bacterium]
PQPKPEPKPQPKPEPKPQPKPEPKRVFRRPEDILKDADFKPVQPVKPVVPDLRFDAEQFAGKLRAGVFEVRVESDRTGSPPSSRSADPQQEQRWLDAVGALLYERWSQPSRSEVGRGNPMVQVTLSVKSDGGVLSTRVTGGSGVLAMDGSVRQMLSSLNLVPAFGAYGLEGASRAVTITFRLK